MDVALIESGLSCLGLSIAFGVNSVIGSTLHQDPKGMPIAEHSPEPIAVFQAR